MDIIKNYKSEKILVYLLFIIVALVYLLTAIFSRGLEYGGDSFNHYLISHYSWQHPELLLHLWGKPFFVLISSVFSHFGWYGMITFNVLCALLTVYLTYAYCKKIGIQNSWVSIILFVFNPIYYSHVTTGLTEPLFVLLLVLSCYLFLNKKYLVGSILISFLPFVRSEGFMILPLFLLVLALKKQPLKIPFLAAGMVVYGIVGYFAKGTFFWFFSQNPYHYYSTLYGHGTFWHFFRLSRGIYGIPLLALIIVGLLGQLILIIQKGTTLLKDDHIVEPFLLMTGSFLIYFLAHCIFWWKGIYGAGAETRVMAGTISGAVVTAMFGLQFVVGKLTRNKILATVLVSLVCVLSVAYTIRVVGFPVGLSQEARLVEEASLWIKDHGYAGSKIYYYNPIVPFALGVDPYDKSKMDELGALQTESSPENSLFFWDAHFGPNEAHLPLENLMRNPNLRLLKTFVPEKPFTTLNGYNFEIYIFVKNK